jgi:Lipase (class 3)
VNTQLVAADAHLALLCLYAEDIGPVTNVPGPDSRLAPEWIVRGTIMGEDALFRRGAAPIDEQVVFYAWLLESTTTPGTFVLAIRGTAGLIEWLEDAEFGSRPHPVAGRVEDGFYGLYGTLRLAGGTSDLAADIAALVGPTGSLTVAGHSLGASLGAYAAFDMAAPERLGGRCNAVLFAPPRPGDRAYGEAFAARLPAHRAYAYEPDIVPRVPFGFGFEPLPGTMEIPALDLPTRIHCSVTCNHHALSYATLIHGAVPPGFCAVTEDLEFLSCIVGAIFESTPSHTHNA